MKIHSIVLSILGTIVFSALVALTAIHVDALAASILWSFPSSLACVMFILRIHGSSFDYLGRFAKISAYTQILQLTAVVAMSYFMSQGKGEFEVRIAWALLIWLVSCLLFYLASRFFGLAKAFKI